MKEFLEYIIKNLVDDPDAISVTHDPSEPYQILTIRAAEGDIGKVIGKQGKTINALRILLTSIASRQGVRVKIELEDETPDEEIS